MKPSVRKAAGVLRRYWGSAPRLGVVLGSGFGAASLAWESVGRMDFGRIPGYPGVGVEGHGGVLELGYLAGERVLLQRGRAHYYEGVSMAEVVFSVRVLAEWGLEVLVLTNAAGGLRRDLVPGRFMVIRDHLNFMGVNPLRGQVGTLVEFVDLTEVYDARLVKGLLGAARRCGVRAASGVYLAVSGPSFETPAKIRAYRRLGADAVGMSTVPEAVVARACGLRVAGISLITNHGAGLGSGRLTHDEVLERGRQSGLAAGRFLGAFVGWFTGQVD